ncbi:MAG: ABC transporter permease [Acidobacteria bacterium]|nr:ABC transporter permease [Acidobacteriota bacterium]
MKLLRKLQFAWRGLFGGAGRDRELSEELHSHLEMEIEMRLGRGETRAEAERGARLALGNLTSVAEETRESWSFAFLTGIGQDLSFAWRLMKKSPVFTLAAVASLGLGIGANTAIFSVFDRVLRAPLAVSEPEDLYQLTIRTSQNKPGSYTTSYSYPLVAEIESKTSSVDAATCSTSWTASYQASGSARRMGVEMVCGNLFEVLGLKAQLGRLIGSGDGASAVAVLANHFWRSEFGADPDVIGRKISLNRVSYTIIGVAPPTYFSLYKGNTPKIYAPVLTDGLLKGKPSDTTVRTMWWLRILVRRKAGATTEQMNAELTPLIREYWRSSETKVSDFLDREIKSMQASVLSASRGYDQARREAEYQSAFRLLLAVVGVVLLIACINIANLLLARATARQKEIATRLALGASRSRLVRQFLTESLALSSLGGLAGLLLALGLERVLMVEAFGQNALVLLPDGLSASVLSLTIGLSLIAGLGFGLLPALSADRQGVGGNSRFTGRKLMVSFQVALSVLLLSAAGLFLQTLENYRRIDSGFTRENLVTMRLSPPPGQSKEALLSYYGRVERKLKDMPGGLGASMSSMGLLVDYLWSSGIHVVGLSIPEGEAGPLRNAVGANFFTVMGASLIEGRDFDESDNRVDAPLVAIVNQTFARRYFGTASPLGRQIGPGIRTGDVAKHYTVVGVVADLRDARINVSPERYWYVPLAQQERVDSVDVYVRTSASGPGVAEVRSAIAALDIGVPISEEGTVSLAVEAQLRQERLVARLSAFFAGVALLLAVVGLYGVMAYTVERKTKEIGIRMALGESRGEILWKVMRETLIYVGLGVSLGVPMAIGLGRLAEKMLFGVKPADWLSIGLAVTSIGVFGLLAGLITARRAASIEPLAALRIE